MNIAIVADRPIDCPAKVSDAGVPVGESRETLESEEVAERESFQKYASFLQKKRILLLFSVKKYAFSM